MPADQPADEEKRETDAADDRVERDAATESAVEVDGDGDPAEVTPPGSGSATRRGLLLVGVLLLGLVVGRVTAPEGETPEDAAQEESRGLPFPTGDVDRTNYWGLAGLLPRVTDTFEREDADELGDTESGTSWEVFGGAWGTTDETAVFLGGRGSGQSIAVVADGGTGPGLTEVTMTSIEPGTGVVFRYLDEDNHWTVVARPNVGNWAVNRVLDGESELVGEFPGAASDGTTVTVIQNQAVIRFLIDGEDQFILTDPELSEHRQGGLVSALRSAGQTRWDRFLVMGFGEDDG